MNNGRTRNNRQKLKCPFQSTYEEKLLHGVGSKAAAEVAQGVEYDLLGCTALSMASRAREVVLSALP